MAGALGAPSYSLQLVWIVFLSYLYWLSGKGSHIAGGCSALLRALRRVGADVQQMRDRRHPEHLLQQQGPLLAVRGYNLNRGHATFGRHSLHGCDLPEDPVNGG